uniref:Uncharacterized protein n=1 Tax=Leersia perrieri TaxID=77586 RepID=A0A0D9W3S5_9ORYZ
MGPGLLERCVRWAQQPSPSSLVFVRVAAEIRLVHRLANEKESGANSRASTHLASHNRYAKPAAAIVVAPASGQPLEEEGEVVAAAMERGKEGGGGEGGREVEEEEEGAPAEGREREAEKEEKG